MVLSVWPMAWRWQKLLAARGIHDKLSWLVRAYFVAYTAGQVLPTAVGGDAVRIYETAKRHPGEGGPVAGSVLLERALGGAATLTLAGVGFALAVGRYNVGPYVWIELGFVVATVLLAIGLFSRRARPVLARTVPLLRKIRVERPIRATYESIHSYREHPRLLGGVFALTVAVQSVRVLAIWSAGKAVGVEPLAAALLRDGPAALPRPADAVHGQRDRGAGVVLRQLPRRARRERGQGLRDRASCSSRSRSASRCPARSCSPGRACAGSGVPSSPPAAPWLNLPVVVVTYNALPWIDRCLESVRGYETIVVDHGSTDGTLELVRERFPQARVIQQENKGLGGGSNAGMRVASGDYFLLLNSDAWAVGDAVDRLAAFAEEHPEAAVVGPKLLNPDGSLQRSVRGFPTLWRLTTEYFFLRKLAPRTRALNAFYGARFDARPGARGRVADGRLPARPARGRRYRWPLRRGLLHVQRGDGLALSLPPRRLEGALLPGAEFVHVGGATTSATGGRCTASSSAATCASSPSTARRATPSGRGGCCSRRCASARWPSAAGAGRPTPRRRAGWRAAGPRFARGEGVNLERIAGATRPAAIVVDVGWVNGLAAIRSLGRAGVPVIAVDHRACALGFRSRYARCRASRPDPQDEDGFVSCLAEIGRGARGRPAARLPHARRAPERDRAGGRRLGGRFRFPFPPWEVPRADPEQARPVRGRRGGRRPVPADPCARLGGGGARRRGRARLPGAGQAVRDRRASSAGSGARPSAARDGDEVERAYAEAEEYEPLVQELIPGGDDALFTLGSYLAADGEPLGLFCGRKLRQTPPAASARCRVGEAVWDDEVVEQRPAAAARARLPPASRRSSSSATRATARSS